MGAHTSLTQIQRFEYEDKRQQVTEIEAMISDFRRIADDLDYQIRAEQQTSGISDVNHFAYPPFARAAAVRRNNLISSIEDLERRLDSARLELEALHEQMKSAETAQELDAERFSKPGLRRRSPRLFGAFETRR